MKTTWKILRRRPSRIVGLILLIFFTLMAIFGPLLYPNMTAVNSQQIYAAPSIHHLLGTDYAGRDIWVQIVQGAQNVMFVAALGALFTIVIGTVVGLAAGYLGSIVDSILMRITDIFLTVPSITLTIILAVTIGLTNYFVMAAILSFASWGGLARAIRSMVMSVRERSFVEVSLGLGLSRARI